jgi:hypothetical protein
MSFANYLQNLDTLENEAYSTGFDIARFFLPDKEILKKILLEKNSLITEEEVELIASIAYEAEEQIDQLSATASINGTASGLTSSVTSQQDNASTEAEATAEQAEAQAQANEAEESAKAAAKEAKETAKRIYKEKVKALKEEVKKLKKEIREAVFMFINKQKEAVKALGLAITNFASALPAAIITATAPPWNIPGAIILINQVIKSYSDLVAIVQMIIPYFEPTRKLPLVIDSSKLNVVGGILNIAVTALLAIFTPIKILQGIIKSIIEFIKSLFKNKNKVFKQATKKLIKLGHIAKIGEERGTQYTELDGEILKLSDDTPITVYAKDDSDIEEIISLLNQFDIQNTRKWRGESHVYRFRKSKSTDDVQQGDPFRSLDLENPDFTELDKLELEINSLPINVPTDLNEYQRFLYNITEEGLNYYKSKYDLTYQF